MATVRIPLGDRINDPTLTFGDVMVGLTLRAFARFPNRWTVEGGDLIIQRVDNESLTRSRVVAIRQAGGVVSDWPAVIEVPLTAADDPVPSFLPGATDADGNPRTWRDISEQPGVQFRVDSGIAYVLTAGLSFRHIDSDHLASLVAAGYTVHTIAEYRALLPAEPE